MLCSMRIANSSTCLVSSSKGRQNQCFLSAALTIRIRVGGDSMISRSTYYPGVHTNPGT